MQILVNGDALEIEEGSTLAGLLMRVGTSVEHVAVEHNGNVVAAADFVTTRLNAQDKLEIVHFVGGG